MIFFAFNSSQMSQLPTLPKIFKIVHQSKPYGLNLIRHRTKDIMPLNADEQYKFIYTLCEYTTLITTYLCTGKKYNNNFYIYYERQLIKDIFAQDDIYVEIHFVHEVCGHVFCYIKKNGIYYKFESSLNDFKQRVTIVNEKKIFKELNSLDQQYHNVEIRKHKIPNNKVLKQRYEKMKKEMPSKSLMPVREMLIQRSL